MDFRLAAKAFIVGNKKLLVLKRSNYTVQKPGIWELPGGRLELGENPFEGLKREVFEETNLKIKIGAPLSVRHFNRVDGQVITLIIFVCSPKTRKVKLSKEHTEFKWLEIKNAIGIIEKFYNDEIREYKKRFKN
jgi:8-oxo-dGTP diphosphatase